MAGKQDIAAGSNGVYYGLTCTFGSGTVASKQKLWEILTSFVADHPEFYWIGSTFAYSISGSGEVKKIIDQAYAKAKNILEENIDILHACAKLLIEKERIDRKEFEALFDKNETVEEPVVSDEENV